MSTADQVLDLVQWGSIGCLLLIVKLLGDRLDLLRNRIDRLENER